MSLRLTNPKQVPRDGYVYIEPSTGRTFGGMYSFSYVAQEVLAYRKGNNLPRATLSEVYEDLDTFTCNRSPELCYDSSIRVSAQVRQVSGCGGCGIVTT